MPRFAVICLLVAALVRPSGAQLVSPPVVEYTARAQTTFGITNQGLAPMAVILEPFAFWVDTLGEVHYAPFDTTVVKLKLSTMSVRLPPRATYNVGYEASAMKLPAWFVITASFAGPRHQGLNVRLQLPHVVYLNQKEPLLREDIAVRAFVYDNVARVVRFKIENVGNRLGRCNDGAVRSAGSDTQVVPSFPLFPHFVRWVELPWKASQPPERLELKFESFTLQVMRRQLASKG